MDYKAYMKERILRRQQELNDRVKGMLDRIDSGILGGEAERLWLDTLAKGTGLDLCAGDFVIGDALGVDGDSTYLGCDLIMPIESIASFEENSFDFIVTNYLEVVDAPLPFLNIIHRIIKPEGVIGIACRNAESYKGSRGALGNVKRKSTFTDCTLKHYLNRSGFKDVEVTTGSDESWLRAKGYK